MIEELATVKLDKERHLRLTLKGMLAFEKLTGKNLLKGFKFKELSLGDTAAMLWACLIHEDKELSYDDVCSMIDFKNLEGAINALSQCLTQSLPEADNSPLAEKPQAG